jgi:DNA-binding transcriptional ArsR family regulator
MPAQAIYFDIWRNIGDNAVYDFLNVTKALSDRNRVRALMALRGRELCVCQIIKLLGLAPSTVSKHMSILRAAGLVDARKEGTWMHYSLAKRPGPAAGPALAMTAAALQKNGEILKDEKELRKILKMKPDELCCLEKKTKKGAEK